MLMLKRHRKQWRTIINSTRMKGVNNDNSAKASPKPVRA